MLDGLDELLDQASHPTPSSATVRGNSRKSGVGETHSSLTVSSSLVGKSGRTKEKSEEERSFVNRRWRTPGCMACMGGGRRDRTREGWGGGSGGDGEDVDDVGSISLDKPRQMRGCSSCSDEVSEPNRYGSSQWWCRSSKHEGHVLPLRTGGFTHRCFRPWNDPSRLRAIFSGSQEVRFDRCVMMIRSRGRKEAKWCRSVGRFVS